MSDSIVNFFTAGVIVAIAIILLAISPMIALWSINTLSEQAHWGWQIPHNVWTYLAIWGIGIVRGSAITTKGKKNEK